MRSLSKYEKDLAANGHRPSAWRWLFAEMDKLTRTSPNLERQLEFLDVIGCFAKFKLDPHRVSPWHLRLALQQWVPSQFDRSYNAWAEKQRSRGRDVISRQLILDTIENCTKAVFPFKAGGAHA